MKKILLLLIVVSCCFPLVGWAQSVNKTPADYVDPLLGTQDSRWMLFPGSSTPFGMVKLSPDNQDRGWKAGYDYAVNSISGFSHIHSWTMAGVLMMPVTGPLYITPGTEKHPERGYRSLFDHKNEVAKPGYYSVFLDDYNTKAELTSTTRTGFHRYTFPKTDSARVMIDLAIDSEYSYEIFYSDVDKVNDYELEGYTLQQSLRGANYNEYTLNFVIRFNKPFTSFNGWIRDEIMTNIEGLHPGWGHNDMGVFVTFNTNDGEPVLAQVGISLVSIDQARLNLEQELNPYNWDFDAVAKDNHKSWNDLLSTITVNTPVEKDKVKFYTNMYRAYVGRTTWSDVNGMYMDMYEKPGKMSDPQSPIYGCDAFWNTFWNINGLWNLATPQYSSKWVNSLLEIYKRGGWLPKGPTGIEYSAIMVASHSIPLIVAAYQAGITDFDTKLALEAMVHQQTVPGQCHEGGGYAGNRALDAYMELGFIPDERGPVSNTLEFAYDDWCVGQFAKKLGQDSLADYFETRSRNFKNVMDPEVKFARIRHSDGTWIQPFDSLCCSTFLGSGYVEGNAWQYTWFVPHDVNWIVDFLGESTFNQRLEWGFEESRPWKFSSERVNYAESLHSMGVLPINHGNQPNMQAAYLFNYSGKPWLTQKWANAIVEEYYGIGPEDGWPGDEDQGQMGAWYVLSSLGLFQMQGGAATEPIWEIGSPIFPEAIIHLNSDYYSGKDFKIIAENVSKKNIYIQKAFLNGTALNKPWLYHSDIIKGGELKLIMGPKPEKNWGSAPENRPPSISLNK